MGVEGGSREREREWRIGIGREPITPIASGVR